MRTFQTSENKNNRRLPLRNINERKEHWRRCNPKEQKTLAKSERERYVH